MREVFHRRYGPRRSGHLSLPGFSERGFEHFVFDEILRSVAAQPASVQAQSHVDLTPRSADRGRDVVISNFGGRELLGFRYPEPPTMVITECKLTGRQRLSFEHVAANLLQLQEGERVVFLLVTNASLTPRSLSLMQDHCARLGAAFSLIDAYNFDRHFSIAEPPPTSTDLQVSYQVLPTFYPERAGYTVHIVVRSYSSGRVEVGVSLHSTRHWVNIAGPITSRVLFGDGATCFSLNLRPRKARSPESVRVLLTINGTPEFFDVSLSPAEHFIDLPLFGSLAESVTAYDSRLRRGSAPDVLFLHSPSGTGKTRFLGEIARRTGLDRVLWLVLREDGMAVVKTASSIFSSSKTVKTLRQDDIQGLLRNAARGASRPRVIFIDDVHLATTAFLDTLESLVLDWHEEPRLIICGRSDPAARKPRYHAFAYLLHDASIGVDGPLQHLTLSNLSGTEVTALLDQLLPGDTLSLAAGLSQVSEVRPVEVVQYIHSLLERGFVYWADENRLAVNREQTELLQSPEISPIAGAILDARLEFLNTIIIADFTLLDVFVLLALIENPEVAFAILKKVNHDGRVPSEVSLYWFREDPGAAMAFPAHDTIGERLLRRCYGFSQNLHLIGALRHFPKLREHLTDLQLAIAYLHEHDFVAATPAMTLLARQLRGVRNVSSLSLEHIQYENIGALIFFLQNRRPRLANVIGRAAIARAYLNMHQQEFVVGLLDCLELLTGLEGADKAARGHLTRVAVRQLVAHGLLNSGDLRTAISLMHEVENALRTLSPSRLAYSVEFDMCDRLQAYYTQQSAFELARSFLLRGRQQAYRTHDEALINISLSAEFHLYRYLDGAEASRLALRQRRHAEDHAPPRSQLHSLVNEAVAQWAMEGDAASPSTLAMFADSRNTSERRGYGHLVPRLDYLLAVDAYRRYQRGETGAKEVQAKIHVVQRSARRYGYGEYTWLAQNLQLLTAIQRGASVSEIVDLATRLIDDLARDGLAFIGGDFLCFQNIIVLSNALRALYMFGDEQTAWRASAKIQFSPLICSTTGERDKRLQSVFDGQLLVQRYDPAAVRADRSGYFTILV